MAALRTIAGARPAIFVIMPVPTLPCGSRSLPICLNFVFTLGSGELTPLIMDGHVVGHNPTNWTSWNCIDIELSFVLTHSNSNRWNAAQCATRGCFDCGFLFGSGCCQPAAVSCALQRMQTFRSRWWSKMTTAPQKGQESSVALFILRRLEPFKLRLSA
jgi:hypothetical protein